MKKIRFDGIVLPCSGYRQIRAYTPVYCTCRSYGIVRGSEVKGMRRRAEYPHPGSSIRRCRNGDVIGAEQRVGSRGIRDREVYRIGAGTRVAVDWIGSDGITGDVPVTEVPFAVDN